MDENKDRRLCTIGAKDVELFDFRRPIGYLSRLSDTGASGFAVRDESRVRLAVERFVIRLIIGGIEVELVVLGKHLDPYDVLVVQACIPVRPPERQSLQPRTPAYTAATTALNVK